MTGVTGRDPSPDFSEYAALELDPWNPHSVIRTNFFSEDAREPETEMEIKIFDVPYLHLSYAEEGAKFI